MKNLHFIFIYLLLVIVSMPEALAQSARSYMNSGIDAYFDGKYEEALRQFNRVERLDTEYPNLYVYRGNTYYMLGEYEDAEMDYELALDNLPANNRGGSRLSRSEADELNQKSAIIYNNLGVAQFMLGNRELALEGFDIALEFDPGLRLATMNARNARSGRTSGLDIQDLGEEEDSSLSQRKRRNNTGRTRNNRGRDRDNVIAERPNTGFATGNPRKIRNRTEDLRERRQENWESLENEDKGGNIIDKILGPKPFIKRSVPRRGKTYKRPAYMAATQKYVTIEQVKIIDRSTFVTFKVMNPTRDSYDVNIARKNEGDAYRIVAVTSTGHKTYPLRRVANIFERPKTTELRSGVPLYFTLEFDRIADNIGIINIVEGNKQSETAWNFYQVDLTR